MKKRKFIKLSKVEQAIIVLAEHIERNPYTEYKVSQEILGILGIERIKDKP